MELKMTIQCPKCGELVPVDGIHDETHDCGLSLLVIDLGDSCVVKVERGPRTLTLTIDGEMEVVSRDIPRVLNESFADVRAAIDGDKPVPRIERALPCDGYDPETFQLIISNRTDTMTNKMHTLYLHELRALSELAGRPLPIWEPKGTWERLTTMYGGRGTWEAWDSDEIGADIETDATRLSFKVWRYTR